MSWDEHAEREEARYADALARMPDDPDPRQKQLVRAAMAAGGAGLARLMQGRDAEAAGWFARSAERYRESWPDAPAGSWGRLIGALKARILAGDWDGAEVDARWALEQDPAEGDSPIGAYAAALARLVLGEDRQAAELAEILRAADDDAFPPAVTEALAGLAGADARRLRVLVRRGCSSPSSRAKRTWKTSRSPTRSSCSRRSPSAVAWRPGRLRTFCLRSVRRRPRGWCPA